MNKFVTNTRGAPKKLSTVSNSVFRIQMKKSNELSSKEIELVANESASKNQANAVDLQFFWKELEIGTNKLILMLRFYLTLEKERVMNRFETINEVFVKHGITEKITRKEFADFLAKLNIIERRNDKEDMLRGLTEEIREKLLRKMNDEQATNLINKWHSKLRIEDEYFTQDDQLDMSDMHADYCFYVRSETDEQLSVMDQIVKRVCEVLKPTKAHLSILDVIEEIKT